MQFLAKVYVILQQKQNEGCSEEGNQSNPNQIRCPRRGNQHVNIEHYSIEISFRIDYFAHKCKNKPIGLGVGNLSPKDMCWFSCDLVLTGVLQELDTCRHRGHLHLSAVHPCLPSPEFLDSALLQKACASGMPFSAGRLLLKCDFNGSLDKRSIQRALVCELRCMVGVLRAGRESSS